MKYIIDTANLDDIRHCVDLYPVAGVTTNPTIISREKTPFLEHITKIREIIGEEMMFHVQLTGTTAKELVEEAVLLNRYVGGNFYVKIPIFDQGLKATMELKKLGINVTQTAIFTQQQALIAAKAGADYVAPYVNRLDSIVSDGVNVVTEIVELFEKHALSCNVLAASFKTVEQIHKIAMCGCHSVTISPELFDTLIYHPMTHYAIDDFNSDWESVYGKESILDMFHARGEYIK